MSRASKNLKLNASDPLGIALRLLSLRDRSTAELMAALQKRGIDEEDAGRVVHRCRELGYLDDQRFALEHARVMFSQGRGVGRRLLFDLQRRGIDPDLAQQALETAETEHPPDQVLRKLLARRFPRFSLAHASDREKRRVVGFFQRRGFSASQIFDILNEQE